MKKLVVLAIMAMFTCVVNAQEINISEASAKLSTLRAERNLLEEQMLAAEDMISSVSFLKQVAELDKQIDALVADLSAERSALEDEMLASEDMSAVVALTKQIAEYDKAIGDFDDDEEYYEEE